MSLLTFVSGSSVYERKVPIARPMADPAYGVMGSVVKLNGQASTDPAELPGKSGNDGVTVAAGSSVSAASGNFGVIDIGRIIRLTGSDAGRYKIASVTSSSVVEVTALDGGAVSFVGGAQAWSIDDTLFYFWRFITVPIGSKVMLEGFRNLDTDSSLVSFSPDVVGEYIVGLTVSNGVFSSLEATTRVSIRAILVPHGRGLIPDGKFIWNYIRDVWQEVEHKEIFETFWSALVQICGAELLKLYQTDFNKSIRDIQDLYQRRWLSYEPKLNLTEADCTFYIGNQQAGMSASTLDLSITGQAIIIGSNDVLVVVGAVLPDVLGGTFRITADSTAPMNVGNYPLLGKNITSTGYRVGPTTIPNIIDGKILTGVQFYFGFQETTWSFTVGPGPRPYARVMSEYAPVMDELTSIFFGLLSAGGSSLIHVGDVIYYPTGPNAGIYRITSISGSYVTVDRKPNGVSELGLNLADIYRPVEYSIIPAVARPVTGSSFSVPYIAGVSDLSILAPGRVVTVGGQTYTILRSFIDGTQVVPTVVVVTDGGVLPIGQVGMSWRVPDTLISKTQNFEELGVAPGDLLEFDITNDNAGLLSRVTCQVVGVSGYRLGFVITNEALTAGVVPPVPNETYLTLSNDFGISGVKVNQDGSLTFTLAAADILNFLNSGVFQRLYWNLPLTSLTDFTILKGIFHVHPKYIIRNSTVPIDDGVKSIPMLQDWIVQPTVVQHDGKTFQTKGSAEYEIKSLPVSLIENSDFIIDGEIAYSGDTTFATGSDVLLSETGHFIDRSIRPGDTFEIETPSTLAGTFYVVAVLSPHELKLNRPIPIFINSPDSVTAKVILRRRSKGRYLRFIPGGFSAKHPAPDRLWAEVTLFDNRQVIEDNFGILVGLTKADLEAVSTDISYRQAVSGLMFAYTHGAAVNKIRLGAQILLGLPFAEHRGIIRSIENDYRLDDLGTPILGRILIEDIDPSGKLLGTLRVYTFPIDLVSVLAGIDVNPATGTEYIVGDTVEAFAALSKGVEVTDYISKPDTSASGVNKVRQYHTAHLRANDSIFSIKEIGLISDFMKRITPSYVSMIISTLSEFADTVSVQDAAFRRLRTNPNDPVFIDQVAMRTPAVPKYDLKTDLGFTPTLFDFGPAWVRIAKSDALHTTYSGASVTATYLPGGLVTPAAIEGPIVKAGDTLVIPTGPNTGRYPITVVTDTTMDVSGLPASGFQTALQNFFVIRYPTGEVRRGVCNSDGAGQLLMEAGLTADGVAVGDVIITEDGYRTVVADVGPHPVTRDGLGNVVPLLTAGQVRVLPVLPAFVTKSYRIYREAFISGPYNDDTAVLHSTGAAYDTFSNMFLRALLEPGDMLQVQDVGLTPLLVIDAAPLPVGQLVIEPVLAVGNYTVKIVKRRSLGAPIPWDFTERFCPTDWGTVVLSETQALAACTAASPVVGLQTDVGAVPTGALGPADVSLVMPGDLLVLTSGANAATDVGYGPGVFPIKSVSSPNVTVSVPMVSNTPSAWKIQRRR